MIATIDATSYRSGERSIKNGKSDEFTASPRDQASENRFEAVCASTRLLLHPRRQNCCQVTQLHTLLHHGIHGHHGFSQPASQGGSNETTARGQKVGVFGLASFLQKSY